MRTNNTCICCGADIPEGRQVCPNCKVSDLEPDAILKDGTHLYLKTSTKPTVNNLQLFLYDLLSPSKSLNYRKENL